MVARCLIEEARALSRKEEATDEDEERVAELYHLADTGLQRVAPIACITKMKVRIYCILVRSIPF
jgi:hypothetical protein